MFEEKNPGLGEYLRNEREKRSMSLEQIASATKINLTVLKSLESDNYEKLPAKPFVRGFATSYCKYLGINADEVLSRFDAFLDEKTARTHKRIEDAPHIFVDKDSSVDNSRTILKIALGSFVVIGLVAVVILKPSLKHRKGRHNKGSAVSNEEIVTVLPPTLINLPPAKGQHSSEGVSGSTGPVTTTESATQAATSAASSSASAAASSENASAGADSSQSSSVAQDKAIPEKSPSEAMLEKYAESMKNVTTVIPEFVAAPKPEVKPEIVAETKPESKAESKPEDTATAEKLEAAKKAENEKVEAAKKAEEDKKIAAEKQEAAKKAEAEKKLAADKAAADKAAANKANDDKIAADKKAAEDKKPADDKTPKVVQKDPYTNGSLNSSTLSRYRAIEMPNSEARQFLSVQAKEDSWIRYQADKMKIRSFKLKAGQKIFVKARESIRFATGNPDGIEVSINRGGFKPFEAKGKLLILPKDADATYRAAPFVPATDDEPEPATKSKSETEN